MIFRCVEFNPSSSSADEGTVGSHDECNCSEIEPMIPQASLPLPSIESLSFSTRPLHAHVGWSLNAAASVPPADAQRLGIPLSPVDVSVKSRVLPDTCEQATVSTRPSYRVIELPLKDIYFYQNYISNVFMDGRPLTDTIEALQAGTITPLTLPLIECLKYRGKWYAIGNRRLACFQYVFRDKPDTLIPVQALELGDHDICNASGSGTQVQVGGGIRIVDVVDKELLQELSPEERANKAALAQLHTTRVYVLKHCTLWKAEDPCPK
jgi:hypothetical protein